MEDLIFEGNSEASLKFFEENYKRMGRIVAITSFFNNSNFLLTKYSVKSDGIHTIIEYEDGSTMQLAGLNCGYGGTGPSATEKMLIILGVNAKTAYRWKFQTGLQISFDESGVVSKVDTTIFFANPESGSAKQASMQCPIGNETVVQLRERAVYMVNPMRYNPAGYVHCLDAMEPIRVDYAFGGEPVEETAFSSEDFYGHRSWVNRTLEVEDRNLPMNFLIYGKRFDMICFIPQALLPRLVEDTHFWLCGKPSADERIFDISAISNGLYPTIKELWRTRMAMRGEGRKAILGSFSVQENSSGSRFGRRGRR